MANIDIPSNEPNESRACDGRVSRKEFLGTLVRRATLAGAILAAPRVVDKFLIPPALAITSTLHINDSVGKSDTNLNKDHTNAKKDSSPIIDTSSPGGGTHSLRDIYDKDSKNSPDDFG